MFRRLNVFIHSFLEIFGVRLKRMQSKEALESVIELLRPRPSQSTLIRLGPNNDGGYLVPNDLEEIKALFSPGVDQISMFEVHCAERGMAVHMADASVEGPANTIKGEWTFEKKFLGSADEGIFINMDGWVNRKCPGSTDLLLQMDIEGAEYDIIRSMSENLLQRFRYMLIEFHQLHQLWEPNSSHQYEAFEKLYRTHTPVHIHPNNCCPIKTRHGIDVPNVLEVTYARKERVSADGEIKLPHELDGLNVKSKPEIRLSNL